MNARVLAGVVLAGLLAVPAPPAAAQYFNSGSTGADGAFSPSCSPTPCTVTVTLPASGVFNYTTVNVPAGVTVKYTRNAANTPVTMLATGNVTIAGTIEVSGSTGGAGAASVLLAPNAGVGGPGGFDGGTGSNGMGYAKGGDGLGPGGGVGGDYTGGTARGGGGGSYLTAGGQGGTSGSPGGATYGTPILTPLIGGSGGGGGAGLYGSSTGSGGGGGGGALLIASGTSAAATTITLTGAIKATGGAAGTGGFGSPPPWGGAASGGAVRLVAHVIAGTGSIDVSGGPTGFASPAGGFGRVRIEAVDATGATLTFTGTPPASAVSFVTATSPPTLTNQPTLTITSVGGVGAPGTLTGAFTTPDFLLAAGTSSATVNFAASNIPLSTTLSVTVRGQVGGVIGTATSSGLSGTVASSTASATVALPPGEPSIISATASFTVVADAGGGPLYADGEPVERVRVTAHLGGASEVTYVTVSGREFVLAAAR